MKAADLNIKISLNFKQIVDLVRQLSSAGKQQLSEVS